MSGTVVPGTINGNTYNLSWDRHKSAVYEAFGSIENASPPLYNGGNLSFLAKNDAVVGDCLLKTCADYSAQFDTTAQPLSASEYITTYEFSHIAQAGCLPPFAPLLAPAIDLDFELILDTSDPFETIWNLTGSRDQFPWFEFYVLPDDKTNYRTLYLYQPTLSAPAGFVGLTYSTTIPMAEGRFFHDR